jgi:hypothetical protein
MKAGLRTALAAVVFCAASGVAGFAQIVPGQLTAAKNLHAVKTPQGYVLSGELQSSSTCMNTRFSPLPVPNSFAAEQYKRPHSGSICGFIVTWKKAVISVNQAFVPHNVRVRVAGGNTVIVPVL